MIPFSELKNNPYKLVNAILAGVILLIFIYSALFSSIKSNHPIPSSGNLFSEQISHSTGLSRSFSSLIRLKFRQAKESNEYGIQLFIFFLIQLGLRIFFLFGSDKLADFGYQKIILIDSIFSGSLFVFFFLPFFKELAYF